jgi:predicted PolB exonuclease-like 3'-5' exonuclease
VTGKPWLCFDCETAPMPGCADYLTDPIEAPANYKDPLKIAAYIEEKRQKQIADAGLDLDLCEVVALAIQFPDECYCQTRESWTEGDILDGFWRFVRTIQREGGNLVGFNCLAFDLPVLLRRSLYLGVPVPNLQIDRYRHDGIVDVAHELTFGGRMTWRSLAFYAKRFGIPHDDSVKGEDIQGLVQAKDWAKVEAHCRSDVASTAALAARIGLIHQPQPAPALEVVA